MNRRPAFSWCFPVAAGLLCSILWLFPAAAEDREAALFDKGYEYLFSFKPEQAAETFRTFLREFPKSSVRDAAMFWLGKTLVHLRQFDEAAKIFASIKEEYPESLFLSHITAEEADIERLKKEPPPERAAAAQGRAPRDAEPRPASAVSAATDASAVDGLSEEITRLKAQEQKLSQELAAQRERQAKSEAAYQETRAERDRLAADAKKAEADLKKLRAENEALKSARPAPASGSDAQETGYRISELERKAAEQEKYISDANADVRRLTGLLEEERKKVSALESEVRMLRGKNVPQEAPAAADTQKRLDAALEENRDLTNQIIDLERRLKSREQDLRIQTTYLSHLMFSQGNRKPPAAQQEAPQTAAADKSAAATTTVSTPPAETAEPFVTPNNTALPASQFAREMAAAAVALRKMGIADLPWRTEDSYESFMNEQALAAEASRSNISPDPGQIRRFSERFRLKGDEITYLRTLLAISGLVNSRSQRIEKSRAIDVLSVQYTQKTIGERALIAAELQKQARAGKQFEDIQKDFPEHVKYSRYSAAEFQKRFREKTRVLEKLDVMREETIVLWTENGYSIIRPVVMRLTFDPLGTSDPSDMEEIRKLVSDMLADLKKQET
ncbi:MAG: hypothetical protein OHK006_23800 [Thermodesulfovibrionales bacterium]